MEILLEENKSLASLTTMGVGGSARNFIIIKNNEELQTAYSIAHSRDMRTVILGGGSNVIIEDEGIDALVIQPRFLDLTWEEKEGDVLVTVGAGVSLDTLVDKMVAENIWGLENLSGIPGSVGAVPIQNVGAYGVEAKDVVENVTVYDPNTNSFKVLTNNECAFNYRDSIFKHSGAGLVVTHVTFRLSRVPNPQVAYKDLALQFGNGAPPSLSEIRESVCTIRKGKFPDWHILGTSGSFFKNPIIASERYNELKQKYPDLPGFPQQGNVKVSLGWILDKVLNLKGYREGNVGLYEKQALVVVNHGGATAEEIISFGDSIIKKIFDATEIKVEREVAILS